MEQANSLFTMMHMTDDLNVFSLTTVLRGVGKQTKKTNVVSRRLVSENRIKSKNSILTKNIAL